MTVLHSNADSSACFCQSQRQLKARLKPSCLSTAPTDGLQLFPPSSPLWRPTCLTCCRLSRSKTALAAQMSAIESRDCAVARAATKHTRLEADKCEVQAFPSANIVTDSLACNRVLNLMTAALHLPAGFFNNVFDNPILTLRPIHYTAEQSDVAGGTFGAGKKIQASTIFVQVSKCLLFCQAVF